MHKLFIWFQKISEMLLKSKLIIIILCRKKEKKSEKEKEN